MGQATHAPGPWSDHFMPPDDGIRHKIRSFGGGLVAVIPERNRKCAEWDMANARLIAAAPDLLEALQAIARGLTNGQRERGETVESIALSAIAKATA